MGRKPHRANAKTYGKLSQLAYKKHPDQIKKGLADTGFELDESLSDRQKKVFYNPKTKKAVVAFRGTDFRDPKGILSDLKHDGLIALGLDKKSSRTKQALRDFDKIKAAYDAKGYSLDTTGHSLGGNLAYHVAKAKPGQVKENLNFNRGSGFGDLFRTRPRNTHDYSHAKDLISLAARLQRSEGGGPSRSHVTGNIITQADPLSAHKVDNLNLDYR